jgi:hypothetical protein
MPESPPYRIATVSQPYRGDPTLHPQPPRDARAKPTRSAQIGNIDKVSPQQTQDAVVGNPINTIFCKYFAISLLFHE